MRQAAGNRGARSVQVRGRDCRLGGGARGAAHVEHFIHGRDEGRVPAERLIEGRRDLPRVAVIRRGTRRAGRAAGRPREAGGGGRSRCSSVGTQRRGRDCRLGGGARGRRTANMACMVVTLDVSKLGSWLNLCAYCRGKQGIYGAGRAAGREAGEQTGATAVHMQRAERGGRDYRLGGRERGAAHVEHLVHVGDAGCIEAEGLVEGLRHLPRIASMA